MSHIRWISVSVILLTACLAGPPAQAQSDQSVADAARRAREQKKAAAKPTAVITNDTLEPQGSKASAVPVSPAPGSETNAAVTAPSGGEKPASDSNAPAAAQPAPEDQAAQQAEIDALKREILEKQKELDLAQRTLNLANDDFYSKPDFSKDTDGKAKLDGMKGEVDQIKDALDQLKAKLPPGVTLEPEKPQAPASGGQPQPPPQP